VKTDKIGNGYSSGYIGHREYKARSPFFYRDQPVCRLIWNQDAIKMDATLWCYSPRTN